MTTTLRIFIWKNKVFVNLCFFFCLFFFPIDTVLKNPSEQFEVLRGTFKLGMVYGLRTRTMATRANMRITEAGLVMIDILCLFLPSAS